MLTVKAAENLCTVSSLSSFIDQGEGASFGSVADAMQVTCSAKYAQREVRVSAPQLFESCGGELSWSSPYPYVPVSGPVFAAVLDNDGNATIVLSAGPSCAPGADTISATLEVPGAATVSAPFTVLAPHGTRTGVSAMPKKEVEDSNVSSVATIVEVAFPSVDAEQQVTIGSQELFTRCKQAPKLRWFGADGESLLGKEEGGETAEVTLNNNGNAYAIALGGWSCASGRSKIEASLTAPPYTSETTNFTIKQPRPKRTK